MDRVYKGQPFTIASEEIRPGEWDLRIGIVAEKFVQIPVKERFATLREAEQYGLRWVKQWVDTWLDNNAHPAFS